MISKEIRKKLGLPKKKKIYHYGLNNVPTEVEDIEILEEYKTWYLIKIKLITGLNVVMHNDFLKEMNKANYRRNIYE